MSTVYPRFKSSVRKLLNKRGFGKLYVLSLVIRILLLAWSVFQDRHMRCKFTDVDYYVFTDAAALVAGKGCISSSTIPIGHSMSPYGRTTYRYTPLIAWLLLPNIYLHASFGKVLFALLDLVVGWLAIKILLLKGIDEHRARFYVGILWLLNPLVVTVSVRGNAESLVTAFVLATLYTLLTGRKVLAAIFYGLAVHLKVYPIIYAPSILLFLKPDSTSTRRPKILRQILEFFHRDCLLFATVSFAVFSLVTYVSYRR